MKKPNSSLDNANFSKIADLLEAPYKLRSQKAALLKLVAKKPAAEATIAIASDSRKLAA
jgi:hypothetical protein